VLDQPLTRPEELEEEVAEDKTFLDALKGLEAGRKYICQFDSQDIIIVMGSKM
jgi:hypothetical protein